MAQRTATEGFVWKTLEQYGVLGVQFILQLFLARILEPEAYGVIAIVNLFISLTNIFVQSGLSTALVQKKQINNNEISSVFNFSLLVAIALYLILFFLSPYISAFFKMPELTLLIRVMSLTIFPFAFNSVQISLLRRELRFKVLFISSISSVLVSGCVAVYFAIIGWGVWALAIQQILYSLLVSATLFVGIKWFPSPVLQIRKIMPLIQFGWKVLLTNVVDELFANLRTLVIGRKYDSKDLSFFNRGRSFPELLTKSVNGSLQAVLLPVLSKNQDNEDSLREIVRRSIMTSSFVMFPLLTLLAISAPSLISVLLTDKWLPCVFFLQVHCIYFATWPITTSNLQALLATGHSGLVLKIEVARKILDIIVLIISMSFGVKGIAWGVAIVSLICLPFYVLPSKKHINYPITEQLRDVLPSIVLSVIIGIIIYYIGYWGLSALMTLVLQVIIGGCIYIVIAVCLKLPAYNLCVQYINNLIKNRKNNNDV